MENTELKNLVFDAIVGNVGEERAETLATMAASLNWEMRSRDVKFSFMKKDGTIREAVGTLRQEVLPQVEKGTPPYTSPKEPNYSCLPYFDVEKQAWRSFKVENLVSAEI